MKLAIFLVVATVVMFGCVTKNGPVPTDLPRLSSYKYNETEYESKQGKSVIKEYKRLGKVWDQNVEITFDPEGVDRDLESFVFKVETLVHRINNSQKSFENAIARRLLSLKNETWLEENEKPISKSQFISRIKLTNISFFSDLSAELYFDDGQLFWGHTIVIDITKSGRVEDANIAG